MRKIKKRKQIDSTWIVWIGCSN